MIRALPRVFIRPLVRSLISGSNQERPGAVGIFGVIGQSLAAGVDSTAKNTTPLPNAFQLSLDKLSLTSLYEGLPAYPDRETQAYSIAARVQSATESGLVHIVRGGVPGANLAMLRADPGAFRTFIDDCIRARDLHAAAGRDTIFRGFAMIHGSSDEAEGLLTWAADFEAYRLALEAELQSVFSQTSSIPAFLSQLGAYPNSVGGTNIPLQQLFAARTYENIYLATTRYQLPYSNIAPVDLHLTEDGYEEDGILLGEAMRRFLVGTPHNGFVPVLVTGGALSQVDVLFEPPTSPMVFNTVKVAANANQGFELGIQTILGSFTSINSVTLNGNTVELGVSDALGASWNGNGVPEVRYAFTGQAGPSGDPADPSSANGNLTDSSSPPYFAPMFSDPITSGLDPLPASQATHAFAFPDGNEQIAVPDGASLDFSDRATWMFDLRIFDLVATNKWLLRRGTTYFSIRRRSNSGGNFLINVSGTGLDNTVSANNIDIKFGDGGFHNVVLIYRGYRTEPTERFEVIIDGEPWPVAFSGTLPSSIPDAALPYNIGSTSEGLNMQMGRIAHWPGYDATHEALWRSGVVRAPVHPVGAGGGLPDPDWYFRPDAGDNPATAIVNYGATAGYNATAVNMAAGDVVARV